VQESSSEFGDRPITGENMHREKGTPERDATGIGGENAV
jgi:hypothetical protein